jgi:hypothetical protein
VDRIAALEEAGVDMISIRVDGAGPQETEDVFRKLQG